jgi:hypothetical protein
MYDYHSLSVNVLKNMLIFDTLEKSIKDYFFILPYRLSIKMMLKNLYKSIITFNKALFKFFDKVECALLGPKLIFRILLI